MSNGKELNGVHVNIPMREWEVDLKVQLAFCCLLAGWSFLSSLFICVVVLTLCHFFVVVTTRVSLIPLLTE